MVAIERARLRESEPGTELALRGYAISPAQCRAARALLDWTQKALADQAGLARKTVAEFESGSRSVQFRSRRDIALAFQQAGIEFIWPAEALSNGDPRRCRGEGVCCVANGA